MRVTYSTNGDWSKTDTFLKRLLKNDIRSILSRFGDEGVRALSSATPMDSGATAASWYYKVEAYQGGYSINWYNSNMNQGTNIAVIIQYGHGTGTGGWVQGRDYINPALRPVFDRIADEAWKAVTGQ